MVALVIPTAAIARAPAKVWIADQSPLVIRGSGFKTHERVTVTVRMSTVHVFHRVATRTGTFVVTVPAGNIKLGCNTMAIQASEPQAPAQRSRCPARVPPRRHPLTRQPRRACRRAESVTVAVEPSGP